MTVFAISLTERAKDGLVEHCNKMNADRDSVDWLTPEEALTMEMERWAQSLANSRGIGTITPAQLIQRILPEVGAINELADSNEQVSALVERLTTRKDNVQLDSQELLSALQLLASLGAIQPSRIAEITAWDHPVFIPAPGG